MQKNPTVISKALAVVAAVIFILAAVLLLPLVNLPHTLLQAETYKRLLRANGAYEQLPALAAEQIPAITGLLAEPCPDDPVRCAMDGTAPELHTCLADALGEETFRAIAGGERVPTRQETRQFNRCIRQARRQARLEHPGLGGELAPLLDDFSAEQWEAIIRFVLLEDDLRRMTESTLDAFFAYLDGKSDTVALPLADVKRRLSGEAGDDFILFLLESEPPCTAGQLAQINAGNFEQGGASAIYCAASGEALARMAPGMHRRLGRVVAQIPDEAVLIERGGRRGLSPLADNLRAEIVALRGWIRLAPFMLLSLLALVTIFGVRSPRGWLRWWGIPLFIAGLLGLAEGIAIPPLLDWAWVNHILLRMPGVLSFGLGELGYDLIRSAVGELARWVMLEAGLLAVLGLAATVGSFFVQSGSQVTKGD